MAHESPSPAQIDRLQSLGKRVYCNPGAAAPTWHGLQEQSDGTWSFPWTEYPEVVHDFVAEASRECWNDHDYDPAVTQDRIGNEQIIANASISELRTLLTYFVRGEKFCDGHWRTLIEKGVLSQLLNRLREFLPQFEYCALKYLNMWLSGESRWVHAMNSGEVSEKLAAMYEFATAYRISRNLHRKYEKDAGLEVPRFQPILDIIDPLTADEFAGAELLPAVERICQLVSVRYGGRRVQSATTKFLWLKLQSPIVIFDRQARMAIGSRSGDLRQYYTRWSESFTDHESEIATVCGRLDEVRLFSVEPSAVTREFINQTASQQWFHERVFDIYLWTIGTRSR